VIGGSTVVLGLAEALEEGRGEVGVVIPPQRITQACDEILRT
jgi:hypothetical protein